MNDFSIIKDKEIVEETMVNLKKRGIESYFVNDSQEALDLILKLIPKGARVLVSSSETLIESGIRDKIENSKDYTAVRKEYMSFDYAKEQDKIRIARSTPDYITASVHAVTKDGEVLIASNTGSQIAAYAGGAGKVIWVVGTQKIVEDIDKGYKRISDYVLPLESERLKKVYGVNSNISKLLIINKEIEEGRIKLIFVNEPLGF